MDVDIFAASENVVVVDSNDAFAANSGSSPQEVKRHSDLKRVLEATDSEAPASSKRRRSEGAHSLYHFGLPCQSRLHLRV